MSKFQQRHYEAVAEVIQEARREIGEEDSPMYMSGYAEAIYNLEHNMADMFARDSGMFLRDRFIKACIPGANVKARSK